MTPVATGRRGAIDEALAGRTAEGVTIERAGQAPSPPGATERAHVEALVRVTVPWLGSTL